MSWDLFAEGGIQCPEGRPGGMDRSGRKDPRGDGRRAVTLFVGAAIMLLFESEGGLPWL
jgi:hypothetical protein